MTTVAGDSLMKSLVRTGPRSTSALQRVSLALPCNRCVVVLFSSNLERTYTTPRDADDVDLVGSQQAQLHFRMKAHSARKKCQLRSRASSLKHNTSEIWVIRQRCRARLGYLELCAGGQPMQVSGNRK